MATPSLLSLLPPLLLLLLLCRPTPATSGACNPNDQKALLSIKSFWRNPAALSSWVATTDCCSWSGIYCKGGHVYELSILDSSLNSTIPPAITSLPFLGFLSLRNNSLTGPVPSFPPSLRRLYYINLSFNRLTGTIPAGLASLRAFSILDLESNLLSGPIPDTFGKLPSESYLFLAGNRLTGPVPSSLGNVNFKTLNLSRNALSGDASFLFRPVNMDFNQYIDISWNAFEFNLSNVRFPESLRELDMSHNRIYGSIPMQITNTSLYKLDVSYNNLCGQIPTGWLMDQFAASSYANNRCLCGKPLPPCK